MRHSFLNLVIVLFSFQLLAQSSVSEKLVEASALRQRGEHKQALAVLESLVEKPDGLPSAELGNAWVLLGSTYQDLGQYTKAERAYQNAISLWKSQPDGEKYEAAALDNLGSLYRDMGQPELSRKLRLRVLQIFQAQHDHAGIARVCNNLSAIALQQSRFHTAQAYLEQAFAETKLLPQPTPTDLAAIYSNAGWLAFHRHDYDQALRDYERALQLWLQVHGTDHELTGLGYVWCGRAHLALGDAQSALEEAQTGIAIIEKTVGTSTPMYFSARLVYADALNATGSTREARTIRAATLQSLESLRRSQLSTSVISAEAFQ